MDKAKCGLIVSIMEDIAPKNLAADWDNVGLLIGDRGRHIKKIMVCLDLPKWVLEEALDKKVDMIITHHPLIFNGIKKINTDSSIGRSIIKLIENNISLYSSHTNFDIVNNGLNDIFARKLGIENFTIIEATKTEKLYKIAVYVPEGQEKKLIESFAKAGAGSIGNYSSCTFRKKGVGTFKPEVGSKPFIGKEGFLEEVNEYKIETVVTEFLIDKVIKEIKKIHPYEEVAYDIYELKNKGNIQGIGRLGDLKSSMTLESYARFVKNAINTKNIRYAGDPNVLIKKVALINGSGASYIKQAKFAGADVLITGDVGYHKVLEALEDGLQIIDAGHFGTEIFMIEEVSKCLKTKLKDLGYGIEIIESKSNTDPIWNV